MSDELIRREVLNPQNSFCITAPAGSGKTSLLTQRVLALLTTVEQPEQVMAITFTRKAASEMRSRVIEAIEDCRVGKTPRNAHDAHTQELASKVLGHAEKYHWQLTVEELNIRTIDGLSALLNRSMPISSGLGGAASITDDASPLYEEAVSDLYGLIGENSSRGQALRDLLLSLDNNWQKCSDLLVTLLGRRTDWLRELGQHNDADRAAQTLTQTLQSMIRERLKSAIEALDTHWFLAAAHEASSAHQRLTEYVAGGLVDERKARLLGCDALCLSEDAEHLEHWQWFVSWLLTNTHTPRKSLNINIGYHAQNDKEAKSRSLGLISELSQMTECFPALIEIAALPRVDIRNDEWEGVIRLSRVLPSLAAQLLNVFQRHGKVDHAHIAMAAEAALGEEGNPTDLALRLDYQLQHILIDEFQDTSIGQFRLVEKLCRDWAEHNHIDPNNPRTLFVVGDAMQSIYGFRYADVRLFLRAQNEGIAGIEMIPRELTRNFRSQAGVIDWVNQQFDKLLPRKGDARLGIVPLTRAEPTREYEAGRAVEVHSFPDSVDRETDFVCNRIEGLLAESEDSRIAVLGRTRTALEPVSAELRLRGIDIVGTDLTSFSRRPAINDLMCLVRWLTNPADNIALFGLFRSPMVGCTLSDLGKLQLSSAGKSLGDMLQWVRTEDSGLSKDGTLRLCHALSALMWGESKRERLNLSAWVEQIWTKLGGPGVISNEERADTESFFSELRVQESAGMGLDLAPILHWYQTRYSMSQSTTARIELMTLHKSKGLEYDYVFMLGAARTGRSDQKPLLRWSRDPEGLLIAAQPETTKPHSLYDYLGHLNKSQQRQELIRLFYVGITRAKRSCVLTATQSSEKAWPPTPTASFWSDFCSAAHQEVCYHEPQTASGITARTASPHERKLYRRTLQSIPLAPYRSGDNSDGHGAEVGADRGSRPGHNPEQNHTPDHDRDRDRDRPYQQPVGQLASNLVSRRYGLSLHKALELLSYETPLPKLCPATIKNAMRFQMRTLNTRRVAIEEELDRLEANVNQVLDNDVARWILTAEHDEAESELALWHAGEARELVIDRTFIDASTRTRWIIDYKTSGKALDETLESFLKRETDKYRSQLTRYSDAMALYDGAVNREVAATKVGLFFTDLCLLHPIEL